MSRQTPTKEEKEDERELSVLREAYARAVRRRDRMKPGGARDRQSRVCGSIYFAILQREAAVRKVQP